MDTADNFICTSWYMYFGNEKNTVRQQRILHLCCMDCIDMCMDYIFCICLRITGAISEATMIVWEKDMATIL